jgi:hypothetical protein
VTQKQYLGKAVQVITFLFAAFSGYLKGIAPPEKHGAFAAGLASFLALVVFLLISGIARGKTRQKQQTLWLRLAAALFVVCAFSGLVYKYELDRLTFFYPPESGSEQFIAGTVPTKMAGPYFEKGLPASEVVARFGGPQNEQLVWELDSINRATMLLITLYLALVLSLAACIFSLTEVVLAKQGTAGKAAARQN